ncbi:hypothetical protein [Methylorubrum suomiense]|uniref:Uncharacterized protein n=1 Tax=Methylorubrum suomiense TaxID=144191 RepID=A0ABQ4UUC2_9HYPH|nr:hypothetical protein [Methylorubrum suomiense]GJE75866.1 hypothetical protein BGCPKDLD_2453 [Methylorubrum suomiense]
MTSAAERRLADARRALDVARDAREANRNADTALAVASAQLRFDEARRALVREEWV